MNKKYKIGGMTCSACSNRVERGVKKNGWYSRCQC